MQNILATRYKKGDMGRGDVLDKTDVNARQVPIVWVAISQRGISEPFFFSRNIYHQITSKIISCHYLRYIMEWKLFFRDLANNQSNRRIAAI